MIFCAPTVPDSFCSGAVLLPLPLDSSSFPCPGVQGWATSDGGRVRPIEGDPGQSRMRCRLCELDHGLASVPVQLRDVMLAAVLFGGYYQPAGPLIHSGSELCRSTKAPPLPTALVLGGAVESQSLESPRPVAGPPTVPPAPAGASSIATGPPPPRSPSADDDASCSEVGLSPLPPTPSSAPLRPPPHSSASSASSASSSSSHVTSPFHRYSTQQQPPPSHHSPHLYPPPYHHPHHAHHQYYAHHHHHPSAGHAALVTHQYAPAHQELCYSPAYSPSPTSVPPSTSSPAAVAAAAAAAFASAQQYLPSGGHKYAPATYRRYTAPPTAAPPTPYYPEVYPGAAAAAAAAAVAAGALPLPGPSSFVADSGAGTYPQAPPPPQEAYPYYTAYNPGPPTCYSHTPPGRSIPCLDATYQPCPCPMQSCPKNVHTGPLTGESKGPGPASAEGSSNGGSNGLSFSPPPVPVSATPSAAPTGNSSTVPPQQLQHSPPPPVALLLLEPHAGNTAGKLLGHPPSPARGSAGGMPPLASCAGPPTPSSTDAAAAAADVAAAAAAASSVSSAGSAVAAAVSAIADENFDGTTNPDPVIEHSVPSVVRSNEDLSSDVREQPVVEENDVVTATEVPQQQQPSSCEEVMGTTGEQQQCLLESKKHYEAWAVQDIHKMEVTECVKGQFDEFVEKEDVLSLMKTGKEVMKESSLNESGKTLMNIGSYQKNYCNSLLYPDSITLKQGAKIMDSCDIRMEVGENEVKGEVKSEDETFKEEKVTDIETDQAIHFHQKASLANFSSPRKRVSSHDLIENSVPSKKIKEDLMNSGPENLIMPVDLKLVPSKKVLAVGEKRPVDSCPSLVLAKKMKNGFKYQHVGECDLNANDHCILEGNLKTAEPSTVSDCSSMLQQTQCASLHLDKLSQPTTHVPKIVPVDCQVEEGSTPEDLQHSCTVNSARIVNGAKDHAVQDVITIPQEMLPPPTSQTCKAKKPPARRRRSHSSETKKICKTSRCDASWSCDESSSTNLPQLSNRANGVLDKSRCISQSHMVRRNSAVGSQPRGSRKGARKVSMLRSLREWPPLTSPVDQVDADPVGAIELQTESDSQEVSESSCLAAVQEPSAPVVTESEPVSSACMPPPLPVTVCKKSKKSGVLPHAKTNKGMNKVSKTADQLPGSPVVDSAEVLAQQLNKFPKKVLMPKWSNGWTWEGQPYVSKIFQTSDNPPVMRKCFPSMRHEEGDLICARDCVLLKSGTRKVDLPYVAKVAALWENPEDGEMMVSLLWYYRPEHTEQGRKKEDMEDEIFASKHKDSNSVACIEDKCYVLTFNEYCRYRKEVRRIEEALPLPPLVVPEASPSQGSNEANGGSSFHQHLEHRRSHHPPSHVSPEMVFFCRRVYDFRQKRILKNPG